MNEDLHIRAFEILERNLPFAQLNSSEKKLVLDAFGSETDYQRMRSVTNLALEEDPLIAPSLSTETSLLKEYRTKHQQSDYKAISIWVRLSRIFNSSFVRYAIPVFVLLLGTIWFLNKQVLENQTVDKVAQVEQLEPTSETEDNVIENGSAGGDFDEPTGNSTIKSPSLSATQDNYSIDGSAITYEPSSDILYDIHPEDLEEEIEDFSESNEFAESDTPHLELSKGLSREEDSMNDMVEDESYTLKEGLENKTTTATISAIDSVTDTPNSAPNEEIANVIYLDDAMGNTIETEERMVVASKKNRYKKSSLETKFSSSSSQSGITDKTFHKFLYATY